LLVSAVGVILEIIFMWDLPSIYALANRAKLLVIAGLSIAAIAIVDWLTKPYISIGFLYLFPVMIVGEYSSHKQIIGVAVLCAFLS
jgi:two-component system, LuxR family, sensor kinase FixL